MAQKGIIRIAGRGSRYTDSAEYEWLLYGHKTKTLVHRYWFFDAQK